jgi:hypothetical protein
VKHSVLQGFFFALRRKNHPYNPQKSASCSGFRGRIDSLSPRKLTI